MNAIVLILFTFLHYNLFASTHSLEETCSMPESDLRYEASGFKDLEEKEKADELIAEFQNVFTPYVKKRLNKKLKVINKWSEAKVNAHATKDNDDNLVIILNGGMIRHPDMKEEGLYFILCHELGHFFGGAPRQFRGQSKKRSWSSAEGQADYFASTKCLPKIFNHLAQSGGRYNIPTDPDDQKEFDKICTDRICPKVILAGLNATKVFSTLKPWWKVPSLKTPNNSQVGVTNLGHPDPQCRLDTIISGSLCQIRDEDFHPTNPEIGACLKKKRDQSKAARPSCWYKAKTVFK